MTALVIAGHDQFPEGLSQTGRFISGAESGVVICHLTSDESPDAYKEKLLSTINTAVNDDHVIILCDLIGGTPFKAAMQVAAESDKYVRIISGINLPGLLTGIMLRESVEIDELVEEIANEVKRAVKKF